MDGSTYPLFYLFALVGLLGVAGWFVFQQVLKTRRAESDLTALQQVVTQGAAGAEEYYRLASIYLDKKLYSQATEYLKRALKDKELKDKQALALISNALGYAYAAQEQYDLAVKQYREALKLQPGYVVAMNNLGFAYEKLAQPDQALALYEQVMGLEPANKTARKRSEILRRRMAPAA
jgi:tetratricopeptide (TPR) repeat protein